MNNNSLFPQKFKSTEKDIELAQLYSNRASKTNPFITRLDLNPKPKKTNNVGFFDVDSLYGTIETPLTGNITVNLTGAKAPNTILIVHNDSVEPDYPISFKKSTASGDYATGEVNYIYVVYMDDDHQIYSISQAAS